MCEVDSKIVTSAASNAGSSPRELALIGIESDGALRVIIFKSFGF